MFYSSPQSGITARPFSRWHSPKWIQNPCLNAHPKATKRIQKCQNGFQGGSKMGLQEAQVDTEEHPKGTSVFKTVPRLI